MRIIKRKPLKDYVDALKGQADQAAVEAALDIWYAATKDASWHTPAELKSQYASASIINSERVVFNIHGNHHRLIVSVSYKLKLVFIIWIGTHKDYDKIDAAGVKYDL